MQSAQFIQLSEDMGKAYESWKIACESLSLLPPLSKEAEIHRQARDAAYWRFLSLAAQALEDSIPAD